MSDTYAGVTLAAANRIGITVDEYLARRAAGEKWCTGCQAWHEEAVFTWKRGYCRPSYLERERRRAAQREREFLDHLLARLLVK